ncbi:MAG: ATP-binding protein [Vulcanimicrobiaceae bacterium]
MSLKITKASDPIRVDRINVCIYGQPGAGKTSLAFTAARPLLLDFDNGAQRAANRKDVVRIQTWADAATITADDLADYETLVVDTAGRALDALTADIIRRNPKAGYGGSLSLQGYGTLKAEFGAWLKMVNGFGKDVLLIAHMDEQRKGDDVLERLDVQGGSKGEIYKASDAMARLFVRGAKRELDFSPRENSFGKNPGQLEVLDIPHPDREPDFLAGVIQQIKDRLNRMTDEQEKAQVVIEEWRTVIAALQNAAEFNAHLGAVKGCPRIVQALFADAARSQGLTFNAKAKAYMDKVA